MRSTILLMIFAFVMLSASGTIATNDFRAEEDSVTNDTFYYAGEEKINLYYDPTKTVVFDFSESPEEIHPGRSGSLDNPYGCEADMRGQRCHSIRTAKLCLLASFQLL